MGTGLIIELIKKDFRQYKQGIFKKPLENAVQSWREDQNLEERKDLLLNTAQNITVNYLNLVNKENAEDLSLKVRKTIEEKINNLSNDFVERVSKFGIEIEKEVIDLVQNCKYEPVNAFSKVLSNFLDEKYSTYEEIKKVNKFYDKLFSEVLNTLTSPQKSVELEEKLRSLQTILNNGKMTIEVGDSGQQFFLLLPSNFNDDNLPNLQKLFQDLMNVNQKSDRKVQILFDLKDLCNKPKLYYKNLPFWNFMSRLEQLCERSKGIINYSYTHELLNESKFQSVEVQRDDDIKIPSFYNLEKIIKIIGNEVITSIKITNSTDKQFKILSSYQDLQGQHPESSVDKSMLVHLRNLLSGLSFKAELHLPKNKEPAYILVSNLSNLKLSQFLTLMKSDHLESLENTLKQQNYTSSEKVKALVDALESILQK